MNYSTFTESYAAEDLNKVERVSYDIPTDIDQWKQIVSNTPVIVIYLWSETCRPCLLVRDKFERLAKDLQSENILFFKDNIDLPTSFHKRQVEVVPTFFILSDGHELRHPIYKSIHNGWNGQLMRDTITFHASESRLLQEKTHQAELQEKNSAPKFYCRNNVCYIQRDE